MLYLIRVYGENNNSILKLGYTSDLKKRLDQYRAHNPFVQVVKTREDGDEYLESLFHRYFYSLGLRYSPEGSRLVEWFLDDPRIPELFSLGEEELEDRIWKNREKAFDPEKLDSHKLTEDLSLFEKLFEKNKDTFSGEEFIVSEDGTVVKSNNFIVDIEFQKHCRRNHVSIEDNKFVLDRTLEIIRICGEWIEQDVRNFLDNKFYRTGIFHEKMKMYCEFLDNQWNKGFNQELQDYIYFKIKDERFRKYYNFYGTSGCKAREYREDRLQSGMTDKSKDSELLAAIHNRFKVGDRYSLKELKSILGNIYRDLGISRTPKAKDLDNYFKLVKTKITLPNKDVTNGYKIESEL